MTDTQTSGVEPARSENHGFTLIELTLALIT